MATTTTAAAIRIPYLQSKTHLGHTRKPFSLRPFPFQARHRLPLVLTAVVQEAASSATPPGAVKDVPEAESAGGETTEASEPTKLYFGNLPYNFDSAQLAGIIQEHATPEMIEVLYDRDTGRSRGFAFVTMSTTEDCETIIQNFDKREYCGRVLRVNFANKPMPKEPLYPESEYKLFIGNLAWTVTSDQLTQMFQECGKVVGARVLYDGETGRPRGYGFVCYSTKEEMDAALETLDGVELEGRPLRVSPATGRRS